MNGNLSALSALGALFIAAVGMTIQVISWIQNTKKAAKVSKEEARAAKDDATKAEAERDAIHIKSSGETLMMMRGMLDLTVQSNTELTRANRELEARVRELEAKDRVREVELQQARERQHREREEYAMERKAFEDRLSEVIRSYEARLLELESPNGPSADHRSE